MSRTCDFCNKKVLVANNISHKQSGQWAKRTSKTKRVLYPNLRVIRTTDAGSKVSNRNICMKCYKKRDTLK